MAPDTLLRDQTPMAMDNFRDILRYFTESYMLPNSNSKSRRILKCFCSSSSGLQRAQAVLLTHGDSIERVCDKFKICATSSSDIVAGIYNEQARIYGVQFHPEVDLTVQGKKMLANFLFEIGRLTASYTMSSRKEECIRYIREKVGSNKVLVSQLT